MQAVWVYITVPQDAEAMVIARALVDERLAAGVNVIPAVRSIYRWKGAVREANELAVVAKTRADLVRPLTDRIRALHTYECPCIIATPITGGNPDYLSWIEEQTVSTA